MNSYDTFLEKRNFIKQEFSFLSNDIVEKIIYYLELDFYKTPPLRQQICEPTTPRKIRL